jgi:predicted RNase H-like HicB family nuclease
MTMRYPIAIEMAGDSTAYGIVVPDLPGCFSAGDTLDEALKNAEEAAAAWIDASLDSGGALPPPSALEAIANSADFKGWSFGAINVAASVLDDKAERVNIVLPKRVLARLDAMAEAAGKSRSGYIASLTLTARR